jgi:Tfp pilus tip-associated adhesin PilY1
MNRILESIGRYRPAAVLRSVLAVAITTGLGVAFGAQTDISSSPLSSTVSAQVKPNVMLLMDTSASMGWGHMPDEVEGAPGSTYSDGQKSVGYKSAQCNVLYYNPVQKYDLPKKPDLSLFPAPSFTAAPYAGYAAYYVNAAGKELTTVNLQTSFQAYDYDSATGRGTLRTTGSNDTPQQAYYYVYSGTQTLRFDSPACRTLDTGAVSIPAVGGGTWTRVLVSSTSGVTPVVGPDELANFATWYTYYRTRIALIKSSASLAFSPLSDSYRVGFITVQPKDTPESTTINSAKSYVAISDFNSTQRGLWFNKIFSQLPGGASPAREGLARVGRHYAGKQDGINAGMTGDPVQYSCQQNFTIMTTDGYWNAQTETPGGGPVKMDGVTLVKQQDAPETDAAGLRPRPIFDGSSDKTVVETDMTNLFSYADCGIFYNVSTTQLRQSTSQLTATTSQLAQSTSQVTSQTSLTTQSTAQLLKSTLQHTQSTAQVKQSTSQLSQRTSQLTRSTSQLQQVNTQLTKSTSQLNKSTSIINRSTSQLRQTTTQLTISTLQTQIATAQTMRSTSQLLKSTTSLTKGTTQLMVATSKITKSTSQLTATVSKNSLSTSQLVSCDSSTELCTPVPPTQTCVTAGLITCQTIATGPTPVPPGTCTPAPKNAGNNYTATTCSTAGSSPATGVASCAPVAASASNGYTETTCNTVVTATDVASCTPVGAGLSNSYVATTCATTSSVPTATGSCTAATANAGNLYVATTCTTVSTGSVGTDTCVAAAASPATSGVATTCSTVTTGPVGAASCSAAGASAANGWVTTTCNTATTGPTAVSACTPAAAAPGNSYLATTCVTNTTGPTPISSCTPQAASAGNSWKATTCPNIVTGPTGTDICSVASAGGGNNYTATNCNTVTVGPTGVSSCTVAAATSGNSYTATACATVTTPPTPVASCTNAAAAAGNSWVATTCATTTTPPAPIGACTNAAPTAANGFTATNCTTVTTGPVNVATCTPVAASAGNAWTATTCATTLGAAVAVATCTPSGPNGTGAGVTCNTATTGPTGVATCTPATASAGNNWTTTTCNTVVTGPTLVAACTAAPAAAGNGYTATTCTNAVTGPTPVAACTPAAAAAGNSFVATTCATTATGPTPLATTCNPVAASAGNSYTATTCNDVATGPTAASTCTSAAAAAGNSYVATTCTPVNTGPTPVATCTPVTANAGNGWTTTTCSTANSVATPAATCTAADPDASNGWVGTICNTVNSVPFGTPSCTPIAASAANNWTATNCNTVAAGPTGVDSCTAAPAGSGNLYMSTVCNSVDTGPTLVATCTPAIAGAGNNWTATTCNTVSTGPTVAATCNASDANAGNNFVATTCTSVPGKKIQYVTTTKTTNSEFSGDFLVSTSSPVFSTGATTDVGNVCYAPGAEAALPTPNPQPAALTAGAVAQGCTSWPCSVPTPHGGGSENSLADVAQYYYATDLRPTMKNNVEKSGSGAEDDRATWQHMTTFTLGLGVSGTLAYDKNYRSISQLTGDFADIRTGARNWPLWPDPTLVYTSGEAWNNAKSIDDYWHTAVNGRGKFFSAGDPNSVVSGLGAALTGIGQHLAAGSAAGASSLQPTAGDNFAFVASYVTGKWTGDLRAELIDLTTGEIGGFKKDVNGVILKDANGDPIRTDPVWSAMERVDASNGLACDNRNIYLVRPGITDALVNFTWNTRACDGSLLPTGTADTGLGASEQANFTGVNVTLLGQYPDMSASQRTDASGERLVNFLRGQKGNEGFEAGVANKLFRTRASALGDIVNSQPVYVKAPFANYGDAGYDTFKTTNASRAPMVYVGANDGMLHAFYAGTSVTDSVRGKEAWALIPSTVLPNLFRLADTNYPNIHQYSVDGTPTVADAYDSVAGAWKTVLVGGLNAGGKGYYAVDVTSPAVPKILWEFKLGSSCYPATTRSDCNLGYTFGRPIISKLTSGKWVVMFTSGYNNVNSAAGDGGGYLYVLDAFTGDIMHKIPTSVGDATTPSGLGQINNFVDNASVNNTTLRVYGADMLGNVWRFDVNDNQPPTGLEASLIGTAKDPSAGKNPQPITARPELAEINGKPMVFVATGRLLGTTDVSDKQVQSIYGIVDPLAGNPAFADLRGALRPLEIATTGTVRTVACKPGSTAECGSTNGWVVDLPEGGERVNVNMELVLGTLVVGSNVPNDDACTAGGHGWINFLNFSTGLAVAGTTSVSTFIDGGLIVGVKTIELDGKFESEVSKSNTEITPVEPPVPPAIPRGNRISWREIAQ